MKYKPEFTGWSAVSLEDLIVAYRKAKADCFYENTFPTAFKFAEYEQNLLGNLKKLLKLLKDKENNNFWKDKELLGKFRLLPKKLSLKPTSSNKNGHAHFSSPSRAFDNLKTNNTFFADFRIVGDFPIETHIISALWINTIGHKLDRCLTNTCYGSRLKRVKDDESLDKFAQKPFHISAIGSFTPYFQPYQRWRNDGLKAIRTELENDKDIIAVSLDLKSYYHLIDPMILASKELLEEIGVELTDDEKIFNEEFAQFLNQWSKNARKFTSNISSENAKVNGGLVIGLTVSSIISNILLYRWDRLVKEKLTPIHYGRYVDDMFLVMHDSGKITNSHEFMQFLKSRLGDALEQISSPTGAESIWQINLGKNLQQNSKLTLQENKQKLFMLEGRAGLDLLDSIEKEIYELSSEHRLMPSPDQLENSTAAKVLSAAGTVGEHADTLRRADGLTIRRLSWSLQLRHVETLANDLPPQEWKKQREEFYQFAHNHVLRPESLFAHFSYLPRLLGFAISMSEWEQAEQIILKSFESLKQLEEVISTSENIAINGSEINVNSKIWRYIKGTLAWLFIDAATKYYDPNKLFEKNQTKKEKQLAALFLNGIWGEINTFDDILQFEFGQEDFYKKAPLVAMSDLAKIPYKRILSSRAANRVLGHGNRKDELEILDKTKNILDVKTLLEFLKSTKTKRLSNVNSTNKKRRESLLPYIFPTRPLNPAEISELAPECVGLPPFDGKESPEKPAAIWAKYTQALRGVWVKPTLTDTKNASEDGAKSPITNNLISIGIGKNQKTVIALTNLKTSHEDWDAMASNKSNLSLIRYQQIANLVNDTLKLSPKPDYVLFPELSIPIQWIPSISKRLINSGISLIAGTEYRHTSAEKVISEAYLSLSDDRLGFPSSVNIWQPKLNPAPNEERELITRFGKEWDYLIAKPHRKKPIYRHKDLHFGVMICSELQNSKDRIKFQGKVDALIILSWNQDLETFSSLVESTALDVHAFTVLINNRMYGDSRVRSPAKENFMRDIARIRGGDNDFVIAATLDIDSLRGFQSKAKRWSLDTDKFKPVPEGFIQSPTRKKSPPSK